MLGRWAHAQCENSKKRLLTNEQTKIDLYIDMIIHHPQAVHYTLLPD